jgi:Ankyrin repeats (many copies)
LLFRYDYIRYAPLVQFLINKGSNLNHKSVTGMDTLHVACRAGNVKMAYLILSAGAYVDTVDSNGDTAFQWCLKVRTYACMYVRVLCIGVLCIVLMCTYIVYVPILYIFLHFIYLCCIPLYMYFNCIRSYIVHVRTTRTYISFLYLHASEMHISNYFILVLSSSL